MDLKLKITDYSLRHYKLVAAVMLIVTLALGALIPKIKVDTDWNSKRKGPERRI